MREANRTIDEVLDVVAQHYGITREQLAGGGRYLRQRRVALYLAHCFTWRSVPEIGDACGGVHHTNVLVAIRKIRDDITKDADLAAEVEGIKVRLRAL